MTFVGLDPDLCRLEAKRFLDAAHESDLLAAEYRDIGRIGLMEEFTNVTAAQLDEVSFELTAAAELLLRKSDEMEALLAPGGLLSLGLGRLPTTTFKVDAETDPDVAPKNPPATSTPPGSVSPTPVDQPPVATVYPGATPDVTVPVPPLPPATERFPGAIPDSQLPTSQPSTTLPPITVRFPGAIPDSQLPTNRPTPVPVANPPVTRVTPADVPNPTPPTMPAPPLRVPVANPPVTTVDPPTTMPTPVPPPPPPPAPKAKPPKTKNQKKKPTTTVPDLTVPVPEGTEKTTADKVKAPAGLPKKTQRLYRELVAKFGRGVSQIGKGGRKLPGIQASRDPDHPAYSTSHHKTGKAIDFFVARAPGDKRTDEQKAEGDRIAAWAIANADALSIDEVIWNGQKATRKNGWRWRKYNGDHAHKDHVHLTVGVYS